LRAVDSAEPPESRVGQVVGEKYRLTRVIGRGGMGVVYEAQHVVVGRRFAVKLLSPHLAGRADLVARVRREAQAAGSLESEHIVQVVDFGHAADGIPFIVMELLAGHNLAQVLRREGPLPAARAAAIAIQACQGLDAAHAAGIVHRDLKPENLFLCPRADGGGSDRELVKILDFGIAKLDSPASPDRTPDQPITGTGSTLGTAFYMSPEQARGDRELDHRADIYAVGVILFECLSGQKPHPGHSYNAILYHILNEPPPSLAALRPELPNLLAAAVHRALSARPENRQASAIDLARDLAPFTNETIVLRPQRKQSAAAAGGVSLPPTVTAPRQPARRWFRIVVAGALAVVAGAIIWAVVRHSRLRHEEPRPIAPAIIVQPPPPPAAPSHVDQATPPTLPAQAPSPPQHRRRPPPPPATPPPPAPSQPAPPPRHTPTFDRSNPYE
jgi:serine/threonine-protein kinase